MHVLDREATIAPAGYNRWLVPPAALAVHLSIGQVYSFSVLKNPLLERFDASHTAVAGIFSIAIVMLGLSAAFGGTWMERNGPRKAMVLAAIFWVTGFLVGALGVHLGQLWILYLGYGVIGGIGLGIGYISPVSTLMKWFPDRPGLATGLAIMGFGGGALVASPLTAKMLASYAPTAVDAIVPTMLTLAAIYGVMMTLGAIVIRVPAPGWAPAGWTPRPATGRTLTATGDVRAARAVRTPQFYLLWVILFVNITAGIGILEQAAPMIQDFFPSVTPATAAGFVGLLSLANLSGRIGWSSASDAVGRTRMYVVYLGVGAALYATLFLAGGTSVALFVVLTVILLSFYGGGFATIPAYLKDLFGTIEVGAIHGRLLTAWSAAGVAGPLIVNSIMDARAAQGVTGADMYLPAMAVMTGLLVVGLVANLLVRPVDARHHEPVGAAAPAPVSPVDAVDDAAVLDGVGSASEADASADVTAGSPADAAPTATHPVDGGPELVAATSEES